MNPRVDSLKSQIAANLQVALVRHRGGESARRVVEGLSDGMDGILRPLFREMMHSDVSQVALLAVGGYGRRELCPQSDIDLMFLRDPGKGGEEIERMVRLLWDGGVQLGHSVRTPEECLSFMMDDHITAAALFEGRYLAGSEALMRRFQEMLNRYRKRSGEHFAHAKLDQLRESVESPERTIFVTEPHLKDGACCLRDIQHILWIERMRRGAKEFEDIAGKGNFSFEDVQRITAAYEFFLRVRCELHFANGLRQDILERDSQIEVARALGYDGDPPYIAVERLMSDYYRHATAVLGFTRLYLETGSRGTRFLSRVHHRLFSSKVGPYLSSNGGRLYLAVEPPGDPEKLPVEIMRFFTESSLGENEISEDLAGWIRRRLSETSPNFSRSADVNRAFLKFLARGMNVGRTLARMHGTGVLGRILPEFSRITNRVNFDGHHQFTVDEHTLRALRELDRIQDEPDYPEKEFVDVLKGIPDRLPLRLALLFHDIGKDGEGRHDVRGTEAALRICERLGVDETTTETVEFLVYLHLIMFKYSERTDFTDDRVVESFARLVERPDQLAMLYLLTYIDIVSVGPGTWTAWKGVQLADLYHRTRILLETGALPGGAARQGKLEEALGAVGFDESKRTRILDHCRLVENPSYIRETIPERMAYHADLAGKFLQEGVVQVGLEDQVGYSEITFCDRDRPHLFADFAGVLLSEGLNILGARIFSRTDGLAIDLFQVEIADRVQVDMKRRAENLRAKLRKIERGKARVTDLISERARRYRVRQRGPALLPPRVHIDNELSETCTVVDVDAGDRMGLLYDLATTLSVMGLDVRAAKVSTLVDRARDVFYVVESGGGKILDPRLQKSVMEALAVSATGPVLVPVPAPAPGLAPAAVAAPQEDRPGAGGIGGRM